MYIETKKTWRKEEPLNEYGMKKITEVGQIENGYLVKIGKEGYESEDRDKYVEECEVLFSSENPLEKKEEKEVSVADSIAGLLKDF